MDATASEGVRLMIGAAVGLGLFLSLDKNGISLFNRKTSVQALGYLFIFSVSWTVLATALMASFGE